MNFYSITIRPEELMSVLEKYNESIILAATPSCDIQNRIGSYRVSLIYHKYKKTYSSQIRNITSSNRCVIYGLIEGASRITAPKDIVIMTANSFGFKGAIRHKGVNAELWNRLFSILESKGCGSVTEIIVSGGGIVLTTLCR